jgi:hypothetical protein
MDPDANLKDQLTLAQRLLRNLEAEPMVSAEEADVMRLAELVLALDEWIRKGGFLPERWRMFR